jgi:hypothetical protein
VASKFSHNSRKNHGRHHVVFVVHKGNLIGFSDGFVGLGAERSLVYNPKATYKNDEVSIMPSPGRFSGEGASYGFRTGVFEEA